MNKYKVGDKITIRSKETMEREFGEGWREIDPNLPFLKSMDIFCGAQLTVKGVDINGMYQTEEIRYRFSEHHIAHNFTYGEELEGRDNEDGEWEPAIFLNYNEGEYYPYRVTSKSDFNSKKFGEFYSGSYRFARKIEKPKEVILSMDEIAEKFGIEVKDLKIKKGD